MNTDHPIGSTQVRLFVYRKQTYYQLSRYTGHGTWKLLDADRLGKGNVQRPQQIVQPYGVVQVVHFLQEHPRRGWRSWLSALRALFPLFALAVGVSGCVKPGLVKGRYGLWTQEGYEGRTTKGSVCTRGAATVAFAERATAVIVDELAKAKAIASAETLLAAIEKRRPHVCVLDLPRPCSGLYTTLGPCRTVGDVILCARRAGCAGDYWTWTADAWPFLCDSRWPDEPNCVNDKTTIRTGLWRGGLFHELFHLVIRIGANVLDNSHRDAIYGVEKVAAERLRREGLLP